MGIILTYFRMHRWQRRVVTALLGLIIACLLSVWLVPIYLDYRWIDQLGSDDPAVRETAKAHLWDMAQDTPATRGRLRKALDTPSDRRFTAVQEILDAVGDWPPANQAGLWEDRLAAIAFDSARVGREIPNPLARAEALNAARRARRVILHEAILAGRDNRYVRRILAAAVADEDQPDVRRAATTLAGRLDDTETLKPLIDDVPTVASAACLVAGLMRQETLLGDLRQALARATTELPEADDDTRADWRNLLAGAAFAVLQLSEDPTAELTELATTTDDVILREQLLWALSSRPRPGVAQAIGDLSARLRWKGRAVPAAVLLAARRLGMDDQGAAALDILTRAAAGEADGLLSSQLIAAIDYALAMNVPCRKQAYDIVRRYWSPGQPVLLSRAARLLGRQAAIDAGQASDAPTRAACIDLLQRTVGYADLEETDAGTRTLTTPFASAHAAVAQWLLDPSGQVLVFSGDEEGDGDLVELEVKRTSGFYLHRATAVDNSDPGDVVAWELARSGRPEALAIGNAFLPDPAQRFREYNAEVRSAGMMLLALTAPDEQRPAIRRRIADRIAREQFYARGAAHCALLILGEGKYLDPVRVLIGGADFPRRRA
ncbi:MAG: hypothetical protein KGY81_03830, partial [Phycisphaerae bacterium]|nr:hypothetical protein [Phycisphaerae bacterium]